MIFLARDYATKREAFGKSLKEHPLHMQTLARMEVSFWVDGSVLHVYGVCVCVGEVCVQSAV